MPDGIPLPVVAPVTTEPGTPPYPYGWRSLTDPYGEVENVQYEPMQMWWDVDFRYLSWGGKVAAVVPNAESGHGGQLQVWRYDDAEEPNASTSVVVVSEDVYACSLAVLPSDVLEVWYLLGATSTTPRRRRSTDGGRTWGEETAYDLGVSVHGADPPYFYPSAAAGLLTHSGNLHGGHWLPAEYHPQTRTLGMVLLGQRDEDGISGQYYFISGKATEDGTDWELNRVRPLQYAGSSSNLGLQALPDGSFLYLPGCTRIQALTGEENAARPALPFILTGNAVGCYDRGRNLVLLIASPPQGGLHYTERPAGEGFIYLDFDGGTPWRCGELGAGPGWDTWTETDVVTTSLSAWLPYVWHPPMWLAGPTWAGTSQEWRVRPPVAGEVVTGLSPPPMDIFRDYYQSAAGMLRQLPDGTWEWLRPTADGSLHFARCADLKRTTEATWTDTP